MNIPVVILLTIRNEAVNLPANINTIYRAILRYFPKENYRIIIAENDSVDDSKTILDNWKTQDPLVSIYNFDGLSTEMPTGTVRLAFLRNFLLQQALRIVNEDGYIIVLDAGKENTWMEGFENVFNLTEWAAAFVNNEHNYYDIWALRSRDCVNDCWDEVARGIDKVIAVDNHQSRIPSDVPPIEVKSAFGAAGIYKARWMRNVEYIGLNEAGEETCEHVSVNTAISANGGKLYIMPNWQNYPLTFTPVIPPFLDHISFFETKYGFFSLFNNDQYIISSYQRGVHWDDHIIQLLSPYVKSANVILDIGAHVGSHCVAYTKINPSALIYAFEPQAYIFALLQFNVNNNSLRKSRIYLNNCAVGDKCGTTTLASKISDGSNTHIDVNYGDIPQNLGGLSLGAGGAQVAMISVDSLNLSNCDLIKLDVEGAEQLVFLGAKQTLIKYHPAIFFESNFKKLTKEMTDLDISAIPNSIDLLKSYGYTKFLPFPDDNILALFG